MADFFYNSNTLLLHGEGADASTTFTDSSSSPRTVTAVGNVQIDTAQFKYGTASMLFDGTGDYLTNDASAGFVMGTGDFTLEAWVRPASFASGRAIIDFRPTGVNGLYPAVLLDTTEGIYYVNSAVRINGAHGMVAGTWYHVAVCRVASVTKMFVNGVQIGSSYTDTNNYICGASRPVIGANGSSLATEPYNGHIDDLRVTKGVARYTANFTPPTAAFEDVVTDNTATFAASLPMFTFSGVGGVIAELALPMFSLQAHSGAHLAAAMPMFTLASAGGGVLAKTLPMFTLRAEGHDSSGENALEAALPMFTLEAQGGAVADLAMPMFTLEAQATAQNMGQLQVSMPMFTLEASGTTTTLGSLAKSLPMFTMVGYGGAVLEVTVGGFTIEASGTIGTVGSLTATLPMFELEASGSMPNYGVAELLMPMFQAGPYGIARLALPMFTLTAIGTATVTATYEAYALNLNHRGQKDPVDEMTRYNNFPFTHIVRFQGSYFGSNSTGLYLLAGTTDFNTSTPTVPDKIDWAFKTGMDDFKSANKKTVDSAYFAGRLGTRATITLYPGETGGEGYSYRSTRGADAQNYRQQFGRGIKARYYALGANGEDEFDLDSLELNIAQLSRRI